jgi:hypothetical protein
MTSTSETVQVTNAQRWTGRILSGLAILFLLFDAALKLFATEAVAKASAELGIPASLTVPIGVILLVCTLLHLAPRTSLLGAVLLTGYLGGAEAIQLRVLPGWFPLTFPILMGVLVWAGLVLRDPRLRPLFPWRAGR